ncbi:MULTISPECIES: AMP-binding protein [unclassified Flavobacterium]|uniref:AMP-binding protein n=1 Tax=unclassified Flavobacterium TaxID=196869 RepID=UPI001F13A58E|nr:MULTISPECIES: AMP-binding protein [unclassified Flavobacterium]UMY65824.1 AMP-binding protein [Flavobacterium sp. HJ-32-4]
MALFRLDTHPGNHVAAIDAHGATCTYDKLRRFSVDFENAIEPRALLFILSKNTVGAFSGFVASALSGAVPVLLAADTDPELLERLYDEYQPAYIWAEETPGENPLPSVLSYQGFHLFKTPFGPTPLHQNLALLLPTSGSTGSPKLVRHSYDNLEASARNVAAFFGLKPSDRAIAALPMHYTMGLSVITSHLHAGATVLLTDQSLTDGGFWQFIKTHRATSFTGVPYSFEILSKLRFFRMDLPDLELLAQGGGKLNETLFQDYAAFAVQHNKRFIATYGQTEGTARMAFLPPELATVKTGSIGRAIPEGTLRLLDEQGNEIETPDTPGEMVYEGPNVTMGYAYNRSDLTLGDERKGVLPTGDIARRDADGCYYITGRLSRFLKLYGTRVSLDETEQLVRGAFDTDCMCTGNDQQMRIHVTNPDIQKEVLDFMVTKTGLFHRAFEVVVVDEIKRNQAGKTLYQ